MNLGVARLCGALINLAAVERERKVHWKHNSIYELQSLHSPMRATPKSREQFGLHGVSPHHLSFIGKKGVQKRI